MTRMLFLALAATLSVTPALAEETAPQQLMLSGQGRFAQFADMATRTTDSDGKVRMRVLQLSTEAMVIGSHTYVGGWSWWQFECKANGPHTGYRQDFASVRDDGHIGPATPTRDQPMPLAPGGDAAELAAIACGDIEPRLDATDVASALALAKANED
ncbi:hypothetical protein [Brevundimonas sp.]|uniref:hypothetical protein n=1 Tax=Brevundimonas sp. TaxID=1871086 RepID=UPI002FCB7463